MPCRCYRSLSLAHVVDGWSVALSEPFTNHSNVLCCSSILYHTVISCLLVIQSKLLLRGAVDDLMHYCTRPSASCNSASGRPWRRGEIFWLYYKQAWKNCFITPLIWWHIKQLSLSGVAGDDAVLLQNRKVHKICSILSQSVPLVLTKKMSTHTLCFWPQTTKVFEFKVAKHALFPALIHNVFWRRQTVRASSSCTSTSAFVF